MHVRRYILHTVTTTQTRTVPARMKPETCRDKASMCARSAGRIQYARHQMSALLLPLLLLLPFPICRFCVYSSPSSSSSSSSVALYTNRTYSECWPVQIRSCVCTVSLSFSHSGYDCGQWMTSLHLHAINSCVSIEM